MKFGHAKHWTKDTVLFKTGQATASFFILAICFPPATPSSLEHTALVWAVAYPAQQSQRRISSAEGLRSSTSSRATRGHLIISLLLRWSISSHSMPGYWQDYDLCKRSDSPSLLGCE